MARNRVHITVEDPYFGAPKPFPWWKRLWLYLTEEL